MSAGRHPGGDVVDFFVRKIVLARSEHLSEAADNVEWRTYFVIYILNEDSLATVGFEFELGGIGQLVVVLLEFSISTIDVADRLGK